MRSRSAIPFTALSALTAGLFLLDLAVGAVRIPVADVWAALTGGDCPQATAKIVVNIRLIKAVVALLAGAALSVSGLQMQTLFRNPLAGPYVLGISSGASLGVATLVLLSGSISQRALIRMGFVGEMAVSVAALLGALAVMGIIMIMSEKVKGNVVLLIMGVMIGYIANAIIGVLKFFSNDEDVRSYVVWGLGSFSKVSGDRVTTFVLLMLVLIPLSFPLIKTLNLLLLGENYARSLGLNYKRARHRVIFCSCLLTAIVTAYCGPIVFIGLAVPHLCRTIFATSNHRILMPAVTLVGALLALICSVIARMPGFEGALPINSVTALIGAPIVIWVLFSRRRGERL